MESSVDPTISRVQEQQLQQQQKQLLLMLLLIFMKLVVSQSPVQILRRTFSWCRSGRQRLETRIIKFVFSLLGLVSRSRRHATPRGQLLDRGASGWRGRGVSSPLGRYGRQWWRRRGWRGVPREGPQGLLPGQGSTALRGPDPSVCGLPCNPAGCVPRCFWMVHQIQFTDRVCHLLCAAETCTHSANCAEYR